MEIRAKGLSKRFSDTWVFRNLSFIIPAHSHFAVTGRNGSGKSTLLKILAGALPPSEGGVSYQMADDEVPKDEVFRHVSFAAPYAQMIEELNLAEAWAFHRRFKAWHREATTYDAFYQILQYPFGNETRIEQMSSGMKQRVRLAFALLTDGPCVFLDEPTSNLDEGGIQWFHHLLETYGTMRTVVVASNVRDDLSTCSHGLALG